MKRKDHFQLQRRLKSCYKRKILKLGLGLTPACQALVDRMIKNGIERMRSQDATDREEQIYFAEQNLSYYLHKVAQEAQSKGTFPRVDDKTVEKVLKEQCPIWPFC